MGKPDNNNKTFEPVIPASKNIAEVTWKAIILGAIISVLFGVANAYLGLKFGMTVSASIPAAVISMAVLRLIFGKNVTVLENNIVQTVGSAGESLAAGIIFTIPAFFIWSANQELAAAGYFHDISKMHIFWLSMLGGTLGILLMIPLRRYLVKTEHGNLRFPEGTACAEIIFAAALAVLFGFFFVVVAARIVGIVGSSSSPVSGMTIATLLVTCMILLYFGVEGVDGMVTAMSVGAIVCIAVCMSGDIAQDLKTGYLLGATPWKQQLTEFIGLIFPALAMGFTIYYLNEAFGFVEGATARQPLLAPQANVMATVVQGIMNTNLPWQPIIVGGFIALAVELLGISSLPFAIGLYLPLSLSTPIMTGGLIALIIKKRIRKDEYNEKNLAGVLFASGMVAGDALIGVLVAFLIGSWGVYEVFYTEHEGMLDTLTGSYGPWLGLVAFGLLALTLARLAFRGLSKK